MKLSELIHGEFQISQDCDGFIIRQNQTKTIFAILIDAWTNICYFQCPICNNEIIKLIFTENSVYNCSDKNINEFVTSICYTCSAEPEKWMFIG